MHYICIYFTNLPIDIKIDVLDENYSFSKSIRSLTIPWLEHTTNNHLTIDQVEIFSYSQCTMHTHDTRRRIKRAGTVLQNLRCPSDGLQVWSWLRLETDTWVTAYYAGIYYSIQSRLFNIHDTIKFLKITIDNLSHITMWIFNHKEFILNQFNNKH